MDELELKRAAPAWIDDFILEGIWPVGEIHLVAGPSGAGKTSWLVRAIDAWRKGESIFGHKSHPQPFVYISGDRSHAGVLRTFKRLKVDHDKFPILVPSEADRKLPFAEYLGKIIKKHKDIKTFFIEGFATRVPHGKLADYDTVSQFLISLQHFCEKHGATIIGVVHSPKTKEGEGYNDPRQRALGSVGWAGFTETIILVESVDVANPDKQTRRVTILPRNGPGEIYKMEFGSEGYLVPVTAPPRSERNALRKWLDKLPAGQEIKTKDVALKLGVGRSTLHYLLGRAEQDGLIAKQKHGCYIRLDYDTDEEDNSGKREVEPLDLKGELNATSTEN